MLSNLLAESSGGSNWGSIVFIVLIVAAFVAMMIFNSRSNKKRQQESQKMLDAIKPGSKVKTIGGICGVVVEVNAEENTFVLETGTEKSGKAYIKFDKQAVYQTDAVPADEKADKKTVKEEKAAETAEAVPAEPVAEEEATEAKEPGQTNEEK